MKRPRSRPRAALRQTTDKRKPAGKRDRAGFLPPKLFEYDSSSTPALCAVAIGSGHNLKIMAARIFKVSAASSIIGIDLVLPMVMRVCPEWKPAPPNAPQDFIKLHIAHHKGVMLWRNLAVSLVEV